MVTCSVISLIPSLEVTSKVYKLSDSKLSAAAKVISPVEDMAKFSLPTPDKLYWTASPSWSVTAIEATTEPTSVVSLILEPLACMSLMEALTDNRLLCSIDDKTGASFWSVTETTRSSVWSLPKASLITTVISSVSSSSKSMPDTSKISWVASL